MPHLAHQHRRVDSDTRLFGPGAVYHGGTPKATSGGASTVAVYDGLDATGDPIDYFSVAASAGERNYMDDGIILRRGLYVDLGSNVDFFTVICEPEPRELG